MFCVKKVLKSRRLAGPALQCCVAYRNPATPQSYNISDVWKTIKFYARRFLQLKPNLAVKEGKIYAIGVNSGTGLKSGYFELANEFVRKGLLSRVSTQTFASVIRKNAAYKLAFGGRTPLFGLVGVSLAIANNVAEMDEEETQRLINRGILTKDEQLESVCFDIREAVSKLALSVLHSSSPHTIPTSVSLDDLEFGPLLAKGCSAVVYGANCKKVPGNLQPENPKSYPWAVKMMYNYEAESNAWAVITAMRRETVPAWKVVIEEEQEQLLGPRTLVPSHPNIVEMPWAFADRIPALPDAVATYPAALPARLYPHGMGRNMSLFLVMKRYDCSLRDFLSKGRPSLRTSLLLLTQLLEGVAHLNKHGIAHRDLKSDNLLLDLASGLETPTLVITDFGCCLCDPNLGMKVPYRSYDMEKGGNAALMAPEIANAQPGSFSVLNYEKTDVWTVGTLAYEIFGETNPFYTHNLESRTYSETDLPLLPLYVPIALQKVVLNLLKRSPSQRLSASRAATICQLLLWAPSHWFQKETPSASEITQWLLCLTTKLLCEPLATNASPVTEFELVKSFLKRTRLAQMQVALRWIRANTQP